MKQINFAAKATLVAVLSAMGATSVYAASIQGQAEATIVTAITLSETATMNFGKITPGASGGTVTLGTTDTITSYGGTTAAVLGGTVSSGQITIDTGTAGESVTIVVSGGAVNLTSGANTMQFTPNTTHSLGSPYVLGSGDDTIEVGGSLVVAAGQAEGTYTNATAYTVTVNYE